VVVPVIPFSICFEFWKPEVEPTLGQSREFADRISVTMPETTMNENDFFLASKNEVGTAWEFPSVKTVSES
jgi:hypothetical protein